LNLLQPNSQVSCLQSDVPLSSLVDKATNEHGSRLLAKLIRTLPVYELSKGGKLDVG